ncbi:MAG: primosomal protein N' [Bacteroidales bacterium]|nr:primosomal protein N' [Bacteroidales bacterium]
MRRSRHIQVLLPLRLKWEPLYSYSEDQLPSPLAIGDRVRVEFGGKEYVAVVTAVDADEEAGAVGYDRIKPIVGLAEGLDRVSKEETDLWRMVAEYYLCTPGEVYKAAYPAGKVEEEEVKARVMDRIQERIVRLDEKIAKARREDTRARYITLREELMRQATCPWPSPSSLRCGRVRPLGSGLAAIELSDSQSEAYSKIKEIFNKRKTALLRGVTGSGKTEIYLKLAAETLSGGKNVLFMVPEIALSRQLEERIRSHFPDELVVFHSGETLAKRAEAATFIKSRPYLALGTRSSIFLPHRNLGLVIVDEENDPSYKQDNPAPRYNGREAAIMLAGLHGSATILGSATPSLESLYNCSVGRFGLIELNTRYFQAEDSDVEIIDTIAERKKNGMVGSFSRKLIDKIRTCLEKGGQVALLRERRSYSPILQCEECGTIPKCDRCDAALSLHIKENGEGKLVCHYCGRVKRHIGTCPKCGGPLKPLGAGTQKIEEEAAELFPEARIARLDSDSARSRKLESEIIREFSDGKIDILVGTRMVAKGFDFSGLSLVAVIQSDSLLGQQDYRADERALALLEQFRGRCGRRAEKGMFVIQTSQPDHPVYQTLSGDLSDTEAMNKLLSERKLFGYPPYSRVINAVIRDRNTARVELMSRSLAETLGRSLGNEAKVIGPYSPAVDKVGGENIRIIRLLLPKNKLLKANKATLEEEICVFESGRKYSGHIALDVDPV